MTEFTPDCIARLKRASTATITTQLFKRGLRNMYVQNVRPLGSYAENMVGPAFTLRNIPSREDVDHVGVFADPTHPQRHAVENAPAGKVLVIDCRGDTSAASGGEILMTRLQVRGAAGVVSDGAMRDSVAIGRMPFPVFCAGPSAPLNLARHHAVESNVPIGCGGVAVYPGDMIVGDGDGVVVIPAHLAEEVARDAEEQELMETFLLTRIQAGARLPDTYPPNAETRAAYEVWRKERK